MNYVPIIDVSQHQGAINFATMKAQGCQGVILRCCHGQTKDSRFETFWEDANQQFPGAVGVYPFVNPKRGTPLECATFLESCCRNKRVPFIMFDIESYKNESPQVGVIWAADDYRRWLREHVAAVKRLLPNVVLIGYSNASFWNVWVKDEQLASELEWLVPRYPIYSAAGYARNPVPAVDRWEEWAFGVGPAGPFAPAGAQGWEGWQFSAGYNGQGSRYGCSSSDLDLNIVKPDAWARWTQQGVPPPPPPPPTIPDPEEDMAYLFTLHDGTIGLRDVTGSRHVNDGEVQGPLAGMTMYRPPKDSPWDVWIRTELDAYQRRLYPDPPVQVDVGDITVEIPDLKFSGTVTPQ